MPTNSRDAKTGVSAPGPGAQRPATPDRVGGGKAVAIGLGIAVVAVALRGWRLTWGLDGIPGRLGFPDEGLMWVSYIRSFMAPSWVPSEQPNLNYPTLYGYVVGTTANAMHAVGLFDPPPQTLRLFHAGREALLLLRGATALMSLVTVAVIGLTASRMYGRRTGLTAALLAAVTPFEVVYAHVASPDTLLTTWTALTMLVAHQVARDGRWWLAVAAGCTAGAAAATKYTGLATITAVAWAAAERGRRSLPRGSVLLLLGMLGFVVGFGVGCPPCLTDADRMVAAMQNHLRINTTLYIELHNNFLAPTLGWYGRPYAYQLVASLPFVLGWPLYLLVLFGVVVAVRRRELADRVILATILPYFLVIARSNVVYPRYLLPLLPGLVILAARSVGVVPWRRLRVPLLALVWIYTAAFTASQVARFSLDQQHEVARWIAERADTRGPSHKVRVGAPKMMLDYFRLVGPLGAARLAYVELPDGHWLDDAPDFFVLPEWYEIAIERDMPEGPAARDLERLRSGVAGYDRGPAWRSSYLQRRLYTVLDPAFAGDLWQGEIGFTVYVRRKPAPPAYGEVSPASETPALVAAGGPLAGGPNRHRGGSRQPGGLPCGVGGLDARP